jgi:hypothetical protein
LTITILYLLIVGIALSYLANETVIENDYEGYGIRFRGNTVFLIKQTGPFQSTVSLGFMMFEHLSGTWIHVDVTRNPSGEMFVYLNATSTIVEPDISFVDTAFSYSETFVAFGLGYDMMRFDNVSVNSEILITPPETTTTTTGGTPTSTTDGETTPSPINTMMLLAGVGVAGVVIIVAVVWMKKH